MTLLCVFATIAPEPLAISLGLGASAAPEMTPYPLNVQISPIVASIFHISAVYGPIGLCFGYDAPIGHFYHDPIDRFRGPLLSRRLLRGHLLRGCLLRGLLSRRRLFRGCPFRVFWVDVSWEDVSWEHVSWEVCLADVCQDNVCKEDVSQRDVISNVKNHFLSCL